MITLNPIETKARPRGYEKVTNPLSPGYEGPVMVQVNDKTGPDGEVLVPETSKASLEDFL